MTTSQEPQTAVPQRVLAIDALRGFDMFWIIGGRELIKAVAKWLDLPCYDEFDRQLRHVRWEGFVFYDLIFPLFLFVVGAVLPFSLANAGAPSGRSSGVHWRILRRTILLFVLGLIYDGRILEWNPDTFRLSGVLQRIAICYAVCALLVVHTGVRVHVAVLVALLLGYWALLAFVAAPGGQAGDYSIERSLPGWVDRYVLPGALRFYGHGDNEGILSTLGAIATTLLGVLAGHWLRLARRPWSKAAGLVTAGLVCLLVGSVWDASFPIIKNIWTSSYVLYAGGWSLLLLAFFYGVIDVLGWRCWSFFFVVIGSNAILIYVASKFIDFKFTTAFFLEGLARHLGTFEPVLLALGLVAIKWLLLLVLYRKRIFLRA